MPEMDVPLTFALVVARDPGLAEEVPCHLVLLRPDGRRVANDVHLNFNPEHSFAAAIMQGPIPFDSPGDYWMVVEMKGGELTRVPLKVIFQPYQNATLGSEQSRARSRQSAPRVEDAGSPSPARTRKRMSPGQDQL